MPRKSIRLSAFLMAVVFAFPQMTVRPSYADQNSPTHILTTFFPIYLFTLNLTQDIPGLQVDILLPADYGCPHDFSLAPEDIRKIHQADIIVTNGLGLDNFLFSMVDSSRTGHIIDASLLIKPLPLRSLHSHEGHDDENLAQYNPHPFASPRQAQLMVMQIASSLSVLIPESTEKLDANRDTYISRLDSLDKSFSKELSGLNTPRAAAVHEIYDYLARDYNFEIVDVIESEPGQEPSARETIALAARLKGRNIAAIFSEPQYSDRMARTLASEINVPVYELDPLATGPLHPPLDYYEITMSSNLKILLKAMK